MAMIKSFRSLLLALMVLTPIVAQADITSNLTLWHALDDGSGTAPVDSSGNGRTGALAGSPNTPTWTTGCQVNGCLSFDGTNDRMTNAALLSAVITAAAGTAAAWIQPTGSPANQAANVYNLPQVLTNTTQYMGIARGTIASANDSIWFWNWDGTQDMCGGTYANDTWIHAVWVHTGGNVIGYLNGAQACTVASGNTQVTSDPLVFGMNGGATAFFAGLIDEIRYYSRALSGSDVSELYAAGLAQRRRRPLFFGQRRPQPWGMQTWLPVARQRIWP